MGFYGTFCQERRATSCKEQLWKNEGSKSGVYQLFDPTTKTMYEVFCDATSEEGFIWTLIESFSVAIKRNLRKKYFSQTIRKIRKLLDGASFVCLFYVW